MSALDYLAVAPCGCVRGAISGKEEDDGNLKEYAADIARWLRSGYAMERGSIRTRGFEKCGKDDCPFERGDRKAIDEALVAPLFPMTKEGPNV